MDVEVLAVEEAGVIEAAEDSAEEEVEVIAEVVVEAVAAHHEVVELLVEDVVEEQRAVRRQSLNPIATLVSSLPVERKTC